MTKMLHKTITEWPYIYFHTATAWNSVTMFIYCKRTSKIILIIKNLKQSVN